VIFGLSECNFKHNISGRRPRDTPQGTYSILPLTAF
jgi:hypothetical protein